MFFQCSLFNILIIAQRLGSLRWKILRKKIPFKFHTLRSRWTSSPLMRSIDLVCQGFGCISNRARLASPFCTWSNLLLTRIWKLRCVSRFYSTREGKPLSKNLSLDLPWSKFYLLYKEILHHGWSKQHPIILQQPRKRSSHHGSFICYLSKNQTVRMTVSFKIYAIAQYWETPIKIPASISWCDM